MKPTMRDVAMLAGVSISAVSLTLSGQGRIGHETRQRILEAAQQLGYQLPEGWGNASLQRHFPLSVASPSTQIAPRIDENIQRELILLECAQLQQEGYSLSSLESHMDDLHTEGKPKKRSLRAIQKSMEQLPLQPDYDFDEPNEWSAIQAAMPASLPLEDSLAMTALYDKIYGGWLGRAIGCTLGRPLELGFNFDEIEGYLRSGNAFPLNDYVPEILPYPRLDALSPYYDLDHVRQFLRGHIRYAPRDDDLDYAILNLIVLEKYGQNFRTEDLAKTWLSYLTFDSVYTAERIAYANLVRQFQPPDTAVYKNPFREFIGAQIRADLFGYTAPGQPLTAAFCAWKDARLSHVKNGLYGAMMVAAMVSTAFVSADISTLIASGLAVLPSKSRMQSVIRLVLDLHAKGIEYREILRRVDEKLVGYDPVHVLPNAARVVLALLVGQGDFETSLVFAATAGLDTDSNAATVGSIVGVLQGSEQIPEKWRTPLNDTLHSWVREHHINSISDLANRTLGVIRYSQSRLDERPTNKHIYLSVSI